MGDVKIEVGGNIEAQRGKKVTVRGYKEDEDKWLVETDKLDPSDPTRHLTFYVSPVDILPTDLGVLNIMMSF